MCLKKTMGNKWHFLSTYYVPGTYVIHFSTYTMLLSYTSKSSPHAFFYPGLRQRNPYDETFFGFLMFSQ